MVGNFQKSAIEVGQYFATHGAKTFIFTDIATDGTLSGPNILANELLAEATGAEVIVSGGISSLSDVIASCTSSRRFNYRWRDYW